MQDIAIGGVYLPALLLLGVIALITTWALTRLINLAGGYRLVVYRPLVDVALFILVLGLFVFVAVRKGIGS